MTTLDLHSKLQGENERYSKFLGNFKQMLCHNGIWSNERYEYYEKALDQLTTSTINETLAWVREEINSLPKFHSTDGGEAGMIEAEDGCYINIDDLLTLLETKDTN